MAISLPRSARMSLSRMAIRSCPRKTASPSTCAFGSRMSFSKLIIETLLPEPDSPTIPRTSPWLTVKDRPSTAVTTPRRVRNLTARPRTSSSGSPLRRWTSADSGTAHPRVEPGVHDVHHGVGKNDEEGGVQNAAHDDRQVEVLQRVEGELADAGKSEAHPGHREATPTQRPEAA